MTKFHVFPTDLTPAREMANDENEADDLNPDLGEGIPEDFSSVNFQEIAIAME